MSNRLLYSELWSLNPGLAQEFDAIYRESLNIWNEQHLREFTVHGKLHTAQVERNLDSLTRPLQNSRMSLKAEEIFALLSACCLHDVGMQLADEPDARSKHAQYAYELILYSHAQVGSAQRRITLPINDHNARRTIALVAKGHWTEFALNFDDEDYIYGVERGRLRLLGVLLAMADLLDISPVRARYFRSIHRLYDLPPLSELHQKMHDLVKGFRITSPDPAVNEDLQFQLEWRDDSVTTRKMSAWVLKWFDSQWRQLWPTLYKDSGGIIRWADPWVAVKFNPPEGPLQTLSPRALNILDAERAEQLRIDRDEFIRRFKDSIGSNDTRLFIFPKNSELDGRFLSEWCEAHARLYENCLIARVDIQPSAPLDLSSTVSFLIEQWGGHLPTCSDEEALRGLESFMSASAAHSLVSIIVSERYDEELLDALLRILLKRPSSGPKRGRICILLTRGAVGPKGMSNNTTTLLAGAPFTRADIEHHLQTRWGYNEQESREIYAKLSRLGFAEKPGQIYNYLETQYGLSSLNAYDEG